MELMLAGTSLFFAGLALWIGRSLMIVREERASLRAQIIETSKQSDKMEETFKALAADALHAGSESFLNLATERLDKKTTEAQGILEQKTATFQKLVEPIEKTLLKVQTDLGEFERRRGQQFGEISEHLKNVMASSQGLQDEARTLSQALRRPEVRGSWGELQLKRVAELAGMSEHCSFEEQADFSTIEGRQRPDMVVHLPNHRVIIVDSKAVMTAYVDAFETADLESQKSFMARHAVNVRTRVDDLSRKAYWDSLTDKTEKSIDFVVLFIPNEAFLQGAVDADRGLIEDAMKKKVLIVGPVNLVALLKAVAYGWQENQLTENAEKVIKAAKELYDRLFPWLDHMEKVGKNLRASAKSYDDAVSSMNTRVLPAARRLKELGLHDTKELVEVKLTGLDSGLVLDEPT